MALNRAIADFFAKGLAIGAIQPHGDVLELGESVIVKHNTPYDLIAAVEPYIPAERATEAKGRVEASAHNLSVYQNNFGPARAFYYAVFEPRFYMSAEIGLAPRRLSMDLNRQAVVGRRFTYVINNGTTEHVFDQAAAFKFIHDSTLPGGAMVHWTTCLGWVDHGLYNVQPGFFSDLANANGYEVKLIGLAGHDLFFELQSFDDYKNAIAKHASLRNSAICVILRKVSDGAFEPPIQGFYQGGLAAAYALSKIPRVYSTEERVNVALNKETIQSSTCKWSYDADPKIDSAGGNNGVVTGYYSFHTDLEVEPWWMVDLGSEMKIAEVIIYNRLDALGLRAAHIGIKLSSDGETWSLAYGRVENAAFGGADGNPLRVSLNGKSARYVRIDLPGRNALHLDEIEIYGN